MNIINKLITGDKYRKNVESISLRNLLLRLPQRKTDSNLKKIPTFPLALHVEITNRCDNKCVFCARHKMNRPLQHMEEKIFYKIMDECAKYMPNVIYLFKDGDPILHPELCKYITYAKKVKAAKNITISTSANALTPELSQKIIESGLDEIFFSVDSLTEDKYKILKGTDKYSTVLSNIFSFIKIKEKMKSRTPNVTVKILATDLVMDDIALFERMWKNIADTVLIDRELSIWDGTNKQVIDFIGTMKNYNFIKPVKRFPCNRPWYMSCIYVDGKMGVCPEDWDQKTIVGDVTRDTIYDIWHDDKLNQFKCKHIDGEWESLPACYNCGAWMTKNMGNWFVANRERALSR